MNVDPRPPSLGHATWLRSGFRLETYEFQVYRQGPETGRRRRGFDLSPAAHYGKLSPSLLLPDHTLRPVQ